MYADQVGGYPGPVAALPMSQWESPLPSSHSVLYKLVLRALNNNRVTRATRLEWSMGLALINRVHSHYACVCHRVCDVAEGVSLFLDKSKIFCYLRWHWRNGHTHVCAGGGLLLSVTIFSMTQNALGESAVADGWWGDHTLLWLTVITQLLQGELLCACYSLLQH